MPLSARARSAILWLIFALASALGDDVYTVRQRLLGLLCLPPVDMFGQVSEQAIRYEGLLLPNGTWPDINYTDPTDRAVWKTAQHLSRVITMSQAVAIGSGGPTLVSATRLALGWWSSADPQNLNWWWDIISVPQSYSSIFLLLGSSPLAAAAGFPTGDELSAGLRNMFRAAWWNASLGYEVSGTNLVWMLQV